MTSNANLGAEHPPKSSSAAPRQGVDATLESENGEPAFHNPKAEELLHRYLSEIHGYRQLGNAALSELEKRLAALSEPDDLSEAKKSAQASAKSPLMHSSLREQPGPKALGASLNDRLKELSAYLHADLAKHQEVGEAVSRARQPNHEREFAAPNKPTAFRKDYSTHRDQRSEHRTEVSKPTPNAPILDRAWFEERFATMRSSIDQLAEQIPPKRLDTLESQFQQLMERLEARETGRSEAAVEAGLKKLAAYLEDNKKWSSAQDQRIRGVEDRLDQLSGLVAQSHAALSETAKGLEIVARGTGEHLARKAADLVAEKLEPKLLGLDQREPIMELAGEINKLSDQSTRTARITDERIKQLQIGLDESLERLDDLKFSENETNAVGGSESQFEKDSLENRYDHRTIGAARSAAQLDAGSSRIPQHGEPIRYQIPYGEFLPEEERANSRAGLIVAAIILLLASAAMLYLNLRDKGKGVPATSASVSRIINERAPERLLSEPLITASTNPTGATSGTQRDGGDMSEPWLVSVTADPMMPASSAPDKPEAHSSPAAAKTLGDRVPGSRSGQKSGSFRAAAVAGDAEAQFSVGETYLQGRSIDQSLPASERLSKAARWFRRAAEKGHAPSQYRLATLYELGQGAPKDYTAALFWYERAAQQGHVKAMHNLAVLSLTGKVDALDYVSARKWFTKAASHGLADSQYNLAVLYERGFGVGKDPVKAYRWYALAAKGGDAKAIKKRDQLAAALSNIELDRENRNATAWSSLEADRVANSKAPEPPTEQAHRSEPIIERKTTGVQHAKPASWSAQITPLETIVAKAQQLLSRLGFEPGPIDGILGPRTKTAIQAFELKAGLPTTGQLSEMLLAKMSAFLSS